MVIEPIGGLSNRLRCIFSYLTEAKLKGETLIVIWKLSDACPGYFLDYFNPVDDVTFLNTNYNNLQIDYKGCYKHPIYNPDYSLLKPLIEIESIVKDRVEILKNYCAVHIRRTDHIELAKKSNKFTEDSEFVDFINNFTNLNVYVSTDNPITYQEFKMRFSDKIKFDWWIPRKSLRQSGLKEAIIDIWVCKNSLHFSGSGWSSFTDLILDLRNY